jgi:hypothetical protein
MRPFAFLLLLMVSGAFIWDNSHLLHATPETESAFLKSYTPQHVIEQFQCNERGSGGTAKGNSAGASKAFVTHEVSFRSFFPMRSDKLLPLTIAVNDDVVALLNLTGAQILSRSGDARTGFRYDYKLGRSLGTVNISPVSLDSRIHRAMPLPKQMVDVETKVELAEKWYPK